MLSKLTYKILKTNKKRTIVTILGIMFSSALLFGVGLLISTIRDSGIREATLRNGDYHLQVNQLKNKEKEIISKQDNLKTIVYESLIDEDSIKTHQEWNDVNIKVYGYKNINKDYISLFSGTYPKNNNEIIIPQNFAENFNLNINDLYKINNHSYKIVGIYNNSRLRSYEYYRGTYSDQVYFYTAYNEKALKINAYITFKSTNNLFNKIDNFTENINRKIIYNQDNKRYEDINPNYSLIDYYDLDLIGGSMAILFLSIILISTILGLFCIVVIYNSFAISVNERKKMFGVLASIGAYKGQILRSVLLEAIYVSIIGIPLGLLLSVLMTSGVIHIINNVMGELLMVPYQISIYPIFMVISLILVIVTILISAYRPAKKASLVTPIEAIRMNSDIKLNKRKLKSSKLIKKLFNVEGELAYLNLKRNKKRYRTTTISIVISIILFIVFSTYINFGLVESSKSININQSDYNISIYMEHDSKNIEFYNSLKKLKGIDEITSSKNILLFNGTDNSAYYSKEYKNYIDKQKKELGDFYNKYLVITTIDKDEYEKFITENKIDSNTPILINHSKFRILDNETGYIKEIKKMKVYQDNSKISFNICDVNSDVKSPNCRGTIDNLYINNEIINDALAAPSILVSESIYQNIIDTYVDKTKSISYNDLRISIKTNEYKKLDDDINNLIYKYPDLKISYENFNMNNYENNMYFITIKLVLYTFLGFISLIAITSMFNTINTSIELRRSEFATLRSIGISPTGFKKMILLESMFFGFKALIYGLVISLIIVFGIDKLFSLSYGPTKMTLPFPTTYIILASIAVILIITITMFYSIRKVKKDNIIETIRNEAI